MRCSLPFLAVLAACVGTPAVERPAPAAPGVVRGLFDGGWPGPSGRGEPGLVLWLAPQAKGQPPAASCQAPVDSMATGADGHFRLQVPSEARQSWLLCFGGRFGARAGAQGGAGMRVYHYDGAGTDSLQLYCRGHGPSGSPECRWVPWGQSLTWPGGEGYDSLPVPPNVALKLTRCRRAFLLAPAGIPTGIMFSSGGTLAA